MSELIRLGSGVRNQNASVAAAELAGRQWGHVSWRQLRELGIGKATVGRWVAVGRLHRELPGVYAVGHLAACDEGDLVSGLLYAGPGSALSHEIGAWWAGIVPDRPSRLDVSSPRNRRSLDALVVHCPRNLERTWHRRLPITPPARILLDVAPTFPFAALRRALAEAFFLRLVSVEAIEGTLLRGHPGSAILRSALACHTPERARTKSWLEDRFLDLRERFGLPVPEINVSICGFEVDAAWREERVIAELDGGAAHGTVAAVDRDRSRDLKLRAAGWTVLRYSRRQITGDAAAVAADILRALGINHLDALCEARAGMNCPDAISQPRQESQVHG